jgi:16S rRNA (adenine1518-N6/adenine1519-N6)-dimethyltransferase
LIDNLRARQSNDKSLGQHFLNNDEVLDRIIELAEITPQDVILEIGPGPGVLTDRLLQENKQLTCIELDAGVCEFLRDTFPNLDLQEGDALESNWINATKFISNLPYQISSPIIEKITQKKSIDYAVILVQEEFAQRLVVELSSDRGSLGMCTKLDWECSMDIRVAPNCFTPSPQVNSRLVTMRRRDPPENSKLTKLLIRQAFGERRKKLRNTLSRAPKRISRIKGWHSSNYKTAIQSIDFQKFSERPEDLEIEDWLELSRLLEESRRAMG